jgi:uncharacterized protein
VKLEQSFEIDAPLDDVWRALIDVEFVAPCLPGAAITGRDDDGSYRGTFTVKLGPTTAAYNGVLKIEDIDEAAHRATLHARGTDKRGQGGATATIVNTLSEAGDGGTRVEAVTDFTITGRLARFGRGGMIEDVSNRLLRDFAKCLQERLASDAGPAEEDTPAPATEAPAAEAAPAEAAPADAAPAEGSEEEAPTPATPAEVADQPGEPAPLPPSAPPPARPRATAPPAAAPPVKGISLFFSILWERIKRRFRRKG